MNRMRPFILILPLLLAACQTVSDRDTIAKLRGSHVDLSEETLEDGLDKAMESYERFLADTPDSALTPEAIRRLADLKIEKEYGTITEGAEAGSPKTVDRKTADLKSTELKSAELSAPQPVVQVKERGAEGANGTPDTRPVYEESETDFEKRVTEEQQVLASSEVSEEPVEGMDDLEKAGPLEAIALYKKLLEEYPYYNRNDQVLYQMSRAYEELGKIDEAMEVMDRMRREYPSSRYIDEVQFRRAEYFFSHKKYMDAEDAYKTIVQIGVSSSYYELALQKLGWTFYKQELYEDALHRFIALLDHKVSIGYDFEQTEDETEKKRMDDTFRVISLSFSNIGGADSVVEYFERYGKRSYEDSIYSQLAEFYFDKRRYADASETYNAFVERNPFHKASPKFHMRVVEIHEAGGFPSLVLESKKSFATNYGLSSEYWKYFDPDSRPEVLGWLKTNLTDLANHYHACYQDPNQVEDKPANFGEARHWYREFLNSFPVDADSPTINYRLADLLMENRNFGQAAVEYEKTAYDYPVNENSSKAGYAAVYAYRQELALAADENKDTVKREAVRSSLKFADTFPEHEKAAIVLRAAADDLYIMEEYSEALAAATKLIEVFPNADTETVRAAWLVSGHSSYELGLYAQAEAAYIEVLGLLPADDETREGLVDNLAASIYKQGEQANEAQDYRAAADHFLRVSRVAPTSKIRPNAEYDGAMALIELEAWGQAAEVLTGFRRTFPEHELQPEVTQKLAYVYKEDGRLSMAAGEYERIERESQDDGVRGEALQIAAELYDEAGDSDKALEVYRRYVAYFPQPVELNVETRSKIAGILKTRDDRDAYQEELRQIVAIDRDAGEAATERMHYLAAKAALVLAESTYDRFVAIALVEPIETNLAKKQDLMKTAVQEFGDLTAYEFDETTAAATFYLAEIYAHFSKALMTSERPTGLSDLELEQYELVIEEQAYPFEEQAISVHESNLELVHLGVYNEWTKKSMARLAEFMPARYDKPEEAGAVLASLEVYEFAIAGSAPLPDAGAAVASAGGVKMPESGETANTPAGMDTEAPFPAEQQETVETVIEEDLTAALEQVEASEAVEMAVEEDQSAAPEPTEALAPAEAVVSEGTPADEPPEYEVAADGNSQIIEPDPAEVTETVEAADSQEAIAGQPETGVEAAEEGGIAEPVALKELAPEADTNFETSAPAGPPEVEVTVDEEEPFAEADPGEGFETVGTDGPEDIAVIAEESQSAAEQAEGQVPVDNQDIGIAESETDTVMAGADPMDDAEDTGLQEDLVQ